VRDRTGFEAFALSELLEGIENYCSDRAQRNRYYHDEWFVVILDGTPATRGLPLKGKTRQGPRPASPAALRHARLPR
jgi:hypothetical protein